MLGYGTVRKENYGIKWGGINFTGRINSIGKVYGWWWASELIVSLNV